MGGTHLTTTEQPDDTQRDNLMYLRKRIDAGGGASRGVVAPSQQGLTRAPHVRRACSRSTAAPSEVCHGGGHGSSAAWNRMGTVPGFLDELKHAQQMRLYAELTMLNGSHSACRRPLGRRRGPNCEPVATLRRRTTRRRSIAASTSPTFRELAMTEMTHGFRDAP